MDLIANSAGSILAWTTMLLSCPINLWSGICPAAHSGLGSHCTQAKRQGMLLKQRLGRALVLNEYEQVSCTGGSAERFLVGFAAPAVMMCAVMTHAGTDPLAWQHIVQVLSTPAAGVHTSNTAWVRCTAPLHPHATRLCSCWPRACSTRTLSLIHISQGIVR